MNSLLQIQNTIAAHFSGDKLVEKTLQVHGTSNSSALAFACSKLPDQLFSDFNHIFVFPDLTALNAFKADLSFFKPEVNCIELGGFDVSPYSSLYPNLYTIHQRLGFLGQLHDLSLEPKLFLASLKDILQPTLPLKVFENHSFSIKVGKPISESFFSDLKDLGYINSDFVEDLGQFANKGGIVDIFIPSYKNPFRIELFGDDIESIRSFDIETQRSIEKFERVQIIPCKELSYSFFETEKLVQNYVGHCEQRDVDPKKYKDIVSNLVKNKYFPELTFFAPYAYENLSSVLQYSQKKSVVWTFDSQSLLQKYDKLYSEIQNEYSSNRGESICPPVESVLLPLSTLEDFANSSVQISNVSLSDEVDVDRRHFKVESNSDFQKLFLEKQVDPVTGENAGQRLQTWKDDSNSIFVFCNTIARAERLKLLLEQMKFSAEITDFSTDSLLDLVRKQQQEHSLIHIFSSSPRGGFRLPEDHLIFLTEQDFFGNRSRAFKKNKGSLTERTDKLHFSDLSPGDRVVHIQHGVGIYRGLKEMAVQSYPSEFVEIEYKDKDKLYLPIYRIAQIKKYTGSGVIDRLGSKTFEKAQIKVKNSLRDIASELLALYAKRSKIRRPPFTSPREEYIQFESKFPYEETEDQLKCVNSVLEDMTKEQPMDRLICGDVGFGKTEIAMRAAFKAVEDKKQVAILVPTTVLAFQHYENFIKRFKYWDIKIASLSRFTSKADSKKIVEEMKSGEIDIVIGTHRLLSKDVEFYNLGLLIVDEEQRFGVTHKEKIRKFKLDVDTLALSATPIPRTLNMSLVGIKDLSVITTPPLDRLPIRTFLMKYNQETIRKAILNEVERGGQVYFVHNRVQSIYSKLEELQQLVPEVSFKVGHGQMKEDELEKTMLSFFKGEFQVLLCTTIIESGLDNTRANTMILDDAQRFGLSQLYQLRGRVGRGTQRAYCYLLLPPNIKLDKVAQERLKVIQQNTALGSGFKIANHDLELRGAGNLLGDEQSGSVNVVGYDLYYELLENAIREIKGESLEDHQIEPEINLPFSALIPDSYISDIRIRLGYYKALSEITSAQQLDDIEEELRDQFGKPPEEVINLMGLMLIRKLCRDLGIRDISASKKNISLAFTENTKLSPTDVVQLSITQPQKYRITPDNRLIVTPEKIQWPTILSELEHLSTLLK